jgi:hypothetical protein
VPNFLPFSIPGFSALTGLPIAFFCLLLVLGIEKPWLPAKLLDRTVDRATYAGVVAMRLDKPEVQSRLGSLWRRVSGWFRK